MPPWRTTWSRFRCTRSRPTSRTRRSCGTFVTIPLCWDRHGTPSSGRLASESVGEPWGARRKRAPHDHPGPESPAHAHVRVSSIALQHPGALRREHLDLRVRYGDGRSARDAAPKPAHFAEHDPTDRGTKALERLDSRAVRVLG